MTSASRRSRVGDRLCHCVALFILASCLACAGSAPDEPTDASVEVHDESIKSLVESGRFAEAESAARLQLQAMETEHGPDSVEVADALASLGETLTRSGKLRDPETRAVIERGLRIREQALGPEHLDVANHLIALANLERMVGNRDAALRLLERALHIRESQLGADHAQVAPVRSSLGSVYFTMGEYERAKEEQERALAILEQRPDPDLLDLARVLNNLGAVLIKTGEYPRAEDVFERARVIRERELGPDHRDVGSVLMNLAIVWTDTGQYEKAREAYERVVDIVERTGGPGHPGLAQTLHNYGILLHQLGEFSDAQAAYERALHIREEIYGPEHADVASTLHNLGTLYRDLGDFERSRQTFERAIRIQRKVLGADDARTAWSISSLATTYVDSDDCARAVPLFEEAAQILETRLGPDHVTLSFTHSGLGECAARAGALAQAASHQERAIEIREAVFGKSHFILAENLTRLAEIRQDLGDLEGARQLMERSIQICRDSVGVDHVGFAENLIALASLERDTGHVESALDKAMTAERIARSRFLATAQHLAESEALRYEAVRVSGFDLALTELVGGRVDHDTARTIWDELIRSRAMVLDEMAARRRFAATNQDPEIGALAQALDVARAEFSELVVRGADPEDPQVYAELLGQAKGRKQQAEHDLAAASAAFRREEHRRNVGLAEVFAAMGQDSALVSFVSYHQPEGPVSVRRYAALVHSRDHDVETVGLGDADAIDDLVREWRDRIARPPRGVPLAGGPWEADYVAAGQRLRAVLWDPLAGALVGASRVYVVPEGAIQMVNLSTLPTRDGAYLLEQGPLLQLVSTERDLVRHDPSVRADRSLLVFGGVDYGAASLASIRNGTATAPLRGRKDVCDLSGIRFTPLPASRIEAEEIASLWSERTGQHRERDVLLLTGSEADEGAFKRLAPRYGVVHVASHGYFLGEDCVEGERGSDGPGETRPAVYEVRPRDGSAMLRAGLALAPTNAGEDGILTAEEIATLDLSAVGWIVLSACETGVGQVLPSEGVFGLRRAFQIAGSGALVMTLWSVDDRETLNWMRHLYQARLDGLPAARAVQQASRRILRARRDAHRSTHPFYWGAFVAVGVE